MSKIKDRLRNARILLVDDNRGDVTLTQLAFKRVGIDVDLDVAGTAELALSLLRSDNGNAKVPSPDLILLDLNLPAMQGHELLKVLKVDLALRHIPVIILSSSCADIDVMLSYDLYASGYIAKPISPHEFDDVVRKIERYWFDLVHCPPEGELPRVRASR